MRVRRFEWGGAQATAQAIRSWATGSLPNVTADVDRIEAEFLAAAPGGRDAVLRAMSARFDGRDQVPESLRVDPGELTAALARIDTELRAAMELAAANIGAVAEAQVRDESATVSLPQGQTVTLREVPVGSAGVYAPGGRATYPSSVLMCALPARAAGVERIALVSPPGSEGSLGDSMLAAAALCGIEEVYAVGGAHSVFALALGTETIEPVDVIVGPGSFWVQEAKRSVSGVVGIDSYAGPSELMLVAGHDTDPEWAALDLCAQAEHGPDSPLLVAGVEENVLDEIVAATENAAAERPSVTDAPLALVEVPDPLDAIDLANAFAPEHLELLEEDAALHADRVRTAGCVFVGRYGATAFGDYIAGSNHVLPTGGRGRFSGPLGPGTFRRRISKVEVGAEAASALAPQLDALARAEGLPVHGESAMIRSKS
ncbi:MAG TPA: histidinol dehydrogenase [Solirubrobacterales bacterium]|jgi:histidinol dehydrogenase|nr:histidinol dehydrogenase [Solirubrobacterales bacterium]